MNASESIKRDVREGLIEPERLIDVIVDLQSDLQKAKDELEQARERIEALEKQLGPSTTAKIDEAFSMKSEEKREAKRGKKKPKKSPGRRGRISSAEKVAMAERTERVFPVGVPESECVLSHVRPVWRLEENRAVLIAYEIYRGPNNRYGIIPGMLRRSEFGQEIGVAIAHLVYLTGLSFDKVCQVLNFFQGLSLRKSQVDALLRQLSRHWEQEFETLCTLVANSLVVHADETSWSLNSVWALLSEKARVLLFGVHKDAETLKKILDPATFGGIVVSDHAAVYANFSQSQKCWAHLLRKSIKLTLQSPHNSEYRAFTDRLLQIYRAACAAQRDGRMGDTGRSLKVASLQHELFELCKPVWLTHSSARQGLANDFRLLVNELMELTLKQELFTFVTAPPVTQPNGRTQPVSGTNNEAERTLRNPAMARETGRASKTFRGARRRTILVSVLESLRQQLATFTLSSIINEILHWSDAGQSCFTRLLAKLHLTPPGKSILDTVLPVPDG